MEARDAVVRAVWAWRIPPFRTWTAC